MTDWLVPSLWGLLGFCLGAVIVSFVAYSIVQSIRRQWQQEAEKSQKLSNNYVQLLQQTREQIHVMEKEAILLEQQFASAQEIWQEKEVFYQTQKRQSEVEFKQLAQDIISQQGQRLAVENEKQITSLLEPLGNKIHSFQQRVEQNYSEEAKERFSLIKEIKGLQQLNQKISDDAMSLTDALKGQNKIQGGWGEVILERILERSGLEKGREYDVQVSLKTETGKRYQPDVIIYLPDGKQVIVDSKMVLVSYLSYVEAETEEERSRSLKQHLESVRRHVKDLSAKEYHNLEGVTSLDFVLLFIPIEAAFGLALQGDNGLFSEAFEHNIIIVGPSNLLATLRTIQNIWRNEKQSQNAMEIAKQAGAMYDKFVGFVDDMEEVGQKVQQVNRSYDNAMKKLTTGRGNLINRAEQLRVLGAKTNKQLSPKMQENGRSHIVDQRSNSPLSDE